MRRPAILALAVVAAAGCRGGHEPAGAPAPVAAGFVGHTAPGVSFAHPRGWRAATRPDPADGTGTLLEVSGAGAYAQLPPQVGLGREPASTGIDIDAAARFHTGLKERFMPAYEVLGQQDVELAGARAARRIESRYVARLPGGRRVAVRGLDLIVLTDAEQMNFFVRGPASEWDATRLEQAFESLRLRRGRPA